jgi:uncharacterized protein YPO0396
VFAISRGSRSLQDLIAGHANTAEIKRAAKRNSWEIQESFSGYAERMRGLLHIPGEKALEVFNRAIGMKEVGDIDSFVRQFMLPSADTFAFIRDTLQPHYRTLLDCWTAIDRAERQILLLRPVFENTGLIVTSEARIEQWRSLQDLTKPYFSTLHLKLLKLRAIELQASLKAVEATRNAAESALQQLRRERDDLNAAINATDVGPRLQGIEREVVVAEGARHRAQSRCDQIQPLAALLNATAALTNTTSFVSSRNEWENIEGRESTLASQCEERRAACRHRQEIALNSLNDTNDELRSVEQHRVNIPRAFLGIRSRHCCPV